MSRSGMGSSDERGGTGPGQGTASAGYCAGGRGDGVEQDGWAIYQAEVSHYYLLVIPISLDSAVKVRW